MDKKLILAEPNLIENRKIRSLFKWIAEKTGVSFCWVEELTDDNIINWGIARRLDTNRLLVRTRRLLATGALTTALILSANTSLKAQAEADMAEADGDTYGFVFNGSLSGYEVGTSVAIGDINGDGFDDLLMGGYYYDSPSTAYVVYGKGDGFSASIDASDLDGSNGFRILGASDYDYLGEGTAIGDINGDGFDDIAVSAVGGGSAGNRVNVIFGKSGFFGSSFNISSLNGTNGFYVNTAAKYEGSVIDFADVNGDTYADLLIGPYTNGNSYVLFGKSSGFTNNLNLTSLSGTNGFQLNGPGLDMRDAAIAGADINGDGFDDIIIGADNADPVSSNEGEVYVFFGKSGGFSSTNDLTSLNGTNGFKILGENSSDGLGSALEAGDIDNDGYEDVLIGASGYDPDGVSNAGSVYILFGKSTAFSSSIDSSSIPGSLGFRIDGVAGIRIGDDESLEVGDINDDGYGDIIIGDGNINSSEGGAYVILGKSTSFNSTFDASSLSENEGFVILGSIVGQSTGNSVATGDMNGDGYDDVAMGASTGDVVASNAGGAYLFINRRFVSIPGSEGFHMLSSPRSGTIIDNLLSDTWTQGFTGGDITHGSPNVWLWDESIDTDGEWSVLTDITTTDLDAGRGFLTYIFSDDDGPDVGGDAGFPKSLSITPFGGDGTANSGTVVVSTNLGNGRFLLSGNPYSETIDWDSGSGWLKTNMSNTIYIWDSATSDWKEWNGFFGDLGDGVIAPYQGFFVQANGGTGQFAMTEDVIGGSATLLKEAPDQGTAPIALQLQLNVDDKSTTAFVSLMGEGASIGNDEFDALELESLASSYIKLGTVQGESLNVLSINSLPKDEVITIELPIYIEGKDVSSDGTLNIIGLERLKDDGFEFKLRDNESGSEVILNEDIELPVYIHSVGDKKEKSGMDPREIVPTPIRYKGSESPKYTLTISAKNSVSTNEEDKEIPNEFKLLQNYPNPFNPNTVISFDIPNSEIVRLEIFDMIGRKVSTLIDSESMSAGKHSVNFDASTLPSGIYLYRLSTSNGSLTKKLTLMK